MFLSAARRRSEDSTFLKDYLSLFAISYDRFFCAWINVLPELCRSVCRGDGEKGNRQVEKHHESHRSYEDPLEGVFVGEVADIAVRMLCDVDFG